MKYISSLFVLIALFTVGTVKAQPSSKLNGTSYTFVMKDAVNGGEELFDQITFTNNQVSSQTFSKAGYSSSKFIEKNGVNTSNFEFTLSSANEGTRLYRGKVEGTNIDGTIIITGKNGAQVTYAFRGMTTAEWNRTQEMKKANNKN
ncbi:MAG TPA: hypothetical protein PKD91_07580 [Bacteroidia bacterium]|mgnify:CR=1 FL=1|nr:hypothetical protein [Bacteroidia bacterium]